MHIRTESGGYSIDALPGCGTAAISYGVYIHGDKQGRGLGQKQHKERLERLQKDGFDYVIATVNEDNAAEKHILAKNGWKRLDTFRNNSYGNNVELWGRVVGTMTETHIAPNAIHRRA